MICDIHTGVLQVVYLPNNEPKHSICVVLNAYFDICMHIFSIYGNWVHLYVFVCVCVAFT